ILYGVVRERRAAVGGVGRPAPSAPAASANDLLSRFLAATDEAGSLTDQQLRDELVTLFLAGHETTALVLSYSAYLLATHPEAARRWHEEVDAVLGDRPPQAADLPDLRYTEWIVRESMRLYPPAWSIGREALQDTELGGYFVPKGTQMWLIQWINHRDPRW